MINYMEELIKDTNFNQNKPIREIVYGSLRKIIISGIIPAGARIVEKECAERLNISRTPIREALRMLEIEELVEYIPRTGVIAKRISIEDVIEIYKIRQHLEVLAATCAMDNITNEEIIGIEELLNHTEQKNNEGDIVSVIRMFGEFNSKIYGASRMKRLAVMIEKLNEYMQRFRNISISEGCRREEASKEHKEILRAVAEKDRENIDEIIKKHLNDSFEIVITEIM